MTRTITIEPDKPLPPELIERALREATLEQVRSEVGRRNAAARKTRTGGRNGGRPKGTQAAVKA